jgi:RNA polymerase-binding transcription factor DksA
MPTQRTRRILEILKHELAEARTEFEETRDAAEHPPEMGMGDAEGYTTWQAAVGIQDHLAREVEKLEHAIELADQGRYGICEDCGDTIPAPRMHALPYTTRCVGCASK